MLRCFGDKFASSDIDTIIEIMAISAEGSNFVMTTSGINDVFQNRGVFMEYYVC